MNKRLVMSLDEEDVFIYILLLGPRMVTVVSLYH